MQQAALAIITIAHECQHTEQTGFGTITSLWRALRCARLRAGPLTF